MLSRSEKSWIVVRPYTFIAPAILFFSLFFLYPIVYLVYLSFTSWNLISPNKDFVGLANYIELLTSEDFLQVLKNTFLFTVLSVALSIGLSLLLAIWLNRPSAFHGWVQAAVFTPHIISLVSISLIWMWLMDPQFGLLNWLLDKLHLPQSQWLGDTTSALYSLVLVSVWKMVGYNALVFIAGLQSIPQEIYEAAAMDEATSWARFSRLTLPMLSPTLFFLLVVNTIASFQVFDTVKIMTEGGPVNSTNMLVFFIYQNGFDFFKVGYASAAGVVLLILVGLLTLVHFMFLAKRVHYR